MGTRLLVVGTIGTLLLAVGGPAAAKIMISKAHIDGPGLVGDGLHISAHAAQGMWESGIDVVGGLDDARAGSIAELGLTADELGPRYVVIYRLEPRTPAEIVRQELYPYAEGGPVTYTPSGQSIELQIAAESGAITAGWYQSSREFFAYLVDRGLPETNPAPDDRGSLANTVPASGATSWGWIALALAGLVALSFAVVLRARVLQRTG